jgi:hypothetical protein
MTAYQFEISKVYRFYFSQRRKGAAAQRRSSSLRSLPLGVLREIFFKLILYRTDVCRNHTHLLLLLKRVPWIKNILTLIFPTALKKFL